MKKRNFVKSNIWSLVNTPEMYQCLLPSLTEVGSMCIYVYMAIVFQDGHKLKNLKCPSKPKKPLFGHFQDIDSEIRVSEKSNICPRYLPFHVL